jgi:outer membrane protein OmpA-like peptidoglycan-associated protein
VGIAAAQFYPAQTKEPPLLERVLQETQSLVNEVKQIPNIWNGKNTPSDPASTTAPVTTAPDTGSSPVSTQSAPALSNAERQQLETEVAKLQGELQALNNRATSLETRVGTQEPDASLEERLQAIQKQLNPGTASAGSTASQSPSQAVVAPATATLSDNNELMVTLPSDALFGADQKTLRSGTDTILSSIIGDLKQYPGSTIRIAAYTDDQGDAQQDRLRTFEQAKAIEQYLSNQLGDKFHLVTVGYGHTRPLADNSTPVNRQRNRRIEITIEPK